MMVPPEVKGKGCIHRKNYIKGHQACLTCIGKWDRWQNAVINDKKLATARILQTTLRRNLIMLTLADRLARVTDFQIRVQDGLGGKQDAFEKIISKAIIDEMIMILAELRRSEKPKNAFDPQR
jgi:hypothetical protein